MPARVIQVIETDLERRGSGKDSSDPIRMVKQYWSLDGDLLAEVDRGSTYQHHVDVTRRAFRIKLPDEPR